MTRTQARADLATPPGEPGSGWLRYAAAMTLWQAGEMTPEALEVYRICATLDWEDPAGILATRGLTAPQAPPALPAEVRIRALLDEADRCLVTLDGPGIAETRAGIARARAAGQRKTPGTPNPVAARLLPQALAALAEDDATLASAIAAAVPELNWITYDAYAPGTVGAAFEQGHAFASLIGEGAPFEAGDFDFGLFVVAPGVFYRDHRHAAPELYLPLTGPHEWRFAPGAPLVEKPAFTPVWNDPFAPHATRVGTVPFLCLYAWTADAQSVAEVIPSPDWPEIEAQ